MNKEVSNYFLGRTKFEASPPHWDISNWNPPICSIKHPSIGSEVETY